MDRRSVSDIFVIVFALVIEGCVSPIPDISRKEVGRVTSPDSLADVITVETHGGATLSKGYHVFIVPKGKKYSDELKGEILIADYVDSLQVEWISANLLEVSYREARIFHFTNFWNSDEVQNYHYVIEIRLNPLAESSALSEGDRWLLN